MGRGTDVEDVDQGEKDADEENTRPGRFGKVLSGFPDLSQHLMPRVWVSIARCSYVTPE